MADEHSTSDLDNLDNLVERAREDAGAFTQLYRRHYNEIFRYCVHRLFNRTAAEDVTSAVFLKVVENLGDFRGDARMFRYWLFRIATNEINGHLRKTVRANNFLNRLSRQKFQQGDCGEKAETIDNHQKIALLRQAVLTLKPDEQSIITLCYWEKLKPSEIAGVLGSRPATIRSKLSRVAAKLRKAIHRAESLHRQEVI